MKETSSDERLDAMLREWAAHQAATDDQLADLARRIGERLKQVHPSDEASVAPGRWSRHKLAWATAGAIAASIAVLICVRSFNSALLPVPKAAAPADASAAAESATRPIAGQELADKVRLAHEFEQEFPGQFAWLMESGDEIRLGLNQDANVRPARFIAVRFVIESQAPDDPTWKPIQRLDFVTVAQATIQTSLPSNHAANVAIWTYATPDGLVSIDAELALSGPVPVHISSSDLLSAGVPVEIWQSEQDGVKYRVYQVAEVLGDGQLG